VTQHILIIWLATAAAAFSALIDCASKGTANGASAEQAHQPTTKVQCDLERGNALLSYGVTTEEQVPELTAAFNVANAAHTHGTA
jgi:multidrug resistance efflux pump